jgi:23S rRNA (uracil1939-C5)-methyltransferase
VAKVKLAHALKRGDRLAVSVESLANGGDGVAKVDSVPIFIERAAQGDKLMVELFDVRKDFARGQIEEIIKPSAERTEAVCVHYERCGGCQWQHMDYASQLKHKEKLVIDSLTHLGAFADAAGMVAPIIGCADPFHYRNKVQFPVKFKDRQVLAGYFERGSHDLVNIESCPIQPSLMDAILRSTRHLLKNYRISIYDEKQHHGLVRHLNLRMSFASNKVLVTFVINHEPVDYKAFRKNDNLYAFTNLAQELMTEFDTVASVVLNFNQDKGNRILGDKNMIVLGNGFIEEHLASDHPDLPARLHQGLNFRLSTKSFFQVNSLQAVKLLEQIALAAQEALAGLEHAVVVDAYAGVGTIAMWLSTLAEEVVAIEEIGDAVADGQENAALNELENVSFMHGRVEEALPALIAEKGKIDLLVLDPPRKGIDPQVLKAIIETGPKRVIYVSCNPVTLARDLRILANSGENGSDLGYKTIRVQPVDLFPQTYHVETVAVLERRTE